MTTSGIDYLFLRGLIIEKNELRYFFVVYYVTGKMQKDLASNKLNLWCHLLHSNYICRHMFMRAQGDDRYWKVWKWYLSIMTWQRYVQDILFAKSRNCGFKQEKVHVLVFLIRSNIWIMEQIRARNKEGKTKAQIRSCWTRGLP